MDTSRRCRRQGSSKGMGHLGTLDCPCRSPCHGMEYATPLHSLDTVDGIPSPDLWHWTCRGFGVLHDGDENDTPVSFGSLSGWIPSDVGYIWVNTAHNAGHNLRTVCRGKVWEPHVATAVQDYLYGQGRAMDVGAFVGYQALRLAKAAAPHTVYAVEGRARSLGLERNLQRNNALNVQIIPSVIDSHWKLEDTIQKDLLESSIPLCLIKLDCEGCEIHFLKATRDILLKWKPVLIIEIQDDATRQTARLGGQQIIKPEGTRNEVLNLLRDELGYNVSPLLDEDGEETWDYLAIAK